MKNISLYLFAVIALFGASCTNQGFKKTKSGLMYKITSDGKGQPAKKGEFLKLNVIEKIRDSVILDTKTSMPAYIRVDSSRGDYSPGEIFGLLRKGDSAVVVQLADTLARKYGQLPPFIKKKDKITIIFKVVEVFPTEEAVTADRNKEVEKEKEAAVSMRPAEIKAVEEYLASNKINAEKTAKGTYVLVKSVGEGPQADSGMQVSVRYTGKAFPSGKVFESNVPGAEGNKGNNEPLKFVIGTGAMIQGMDDGVRKFKKGGKGTLYVPAFLAYDQQPGPSRKPFENLIFEIEVIDVTTAPAAPTGPMMPNMPQQGNPQQH